MACRGPDDNTGSAIYAELNTVRPALCGILSVLGAVGSVDAVLNAVDWNEAGVTRASFMAWWEQHKQQDAARRQREADQAAQQRLRESGARKLTDAEKAALGIKD